MSDSQKEQSLFSTSVTLHKSLKNHTEREIQCYPIQCLQTSCVVGFCVYSLKSVQPTRTPNYCQTETRTKLTKEKLYCKQLFSVAALQITSDTKCSPPAQLSYNHSSRILK